MGNAAGRLCLSGDAANVPVVEVAESGDGVACHVSVHQYLFPMYVVKARLEVGMGRET